MLKSTSRAIQVLVVEDQEIYRPVYQPVFGSDPAFEFLGVEDSPLGLDIIEAWAGCVPDVLVMGVKDFSADLCLGLCELKKRFPLMGLVVLPVSVSKEVIAQLRNLLQYCKSGIALCLRQAIDRTEQLCRLVTAASQGQIVLDPEVACLVLPERQEGSLLRQLTARELEIIDLLAQGFTNASISRKLFIDQKTVEHHLNNIYSKMKAEGDFENMHPRVAAARIRWASPVLV